MAICVCGGAVRSLCVMPLPPTMAAEAKEEGEMEEKREKVTVDRWLLRDMLRQAAMKGVDQAIEDYREHGDPGEVDSWDMCGGIADEVAEEYAAACTPAPAEGE